MADAAECWRRDTIKLGIVFFTIYFVQGVSGLAGLPISYLVKNVLKLSPADAQFFGAATMLAWLVKPIWGYLSDTFPIRGYRRKSYLIGMSLTAASSWFLLAWFALHNDYRYWTLLILFNFSAMAYAFVDVVCDGLMVENGKRAGLMDQFVNVQWIGAGAAGVIVGVSSGYLSSLANQHPEYYAKIFFIAGIVPLVTALLVLFLLAEEPVRIPFPWRKLGIALGLTAVGLVIAMNATPRFLSLSMGERILLTFFGFALVSVFVWFWAGRPRLFWPINLFLFFWGFSPSVGMAQFYYMTDVLHFSEKFFGALASIDSVFGLIGFVLYGVVFAKFPAVSRKQYLYFAIAVGALGLGAQYLYYLAPGTHIVGLPLNFYAIAIASGIALSMLGAPGWLVPLAIAGDAAKDGKEAVTYAWFMSLSNFSRITFSSLAGGWLYHRLEHADFSRFALFLGTADFLGGDANKALILRLFVWTSALFTLAALPIVYFVAIPERSDVRRETEER